MPVLIQNYPRDTGLKQEKSYPCVAFTSYIVTIFISAFSGSYLYPFVLEIIIFFKITEPSKSIRVSQLAQELSGFVLCDSKVVRAATLFIDALKPAGAFWIHIHCFDHATV